MPHTLVLVPTATEREVLAPHLAAVQGVRVRVELCGFGPVAAAARTAALISAHAPARVVLAGIAGRYDDRLEIGAAYRFPRVACFGVGVGAGESFVPAGTLGWQQWPGDPPTPAAAIGDVLDCGWPPAVPVTNGGLLLTACAAAANPRDVALRTKLMPEAAAEDMEGFAVAVACRLAGVPLAIVRGISNTAGDRNHAHWQIPQALAAAANLTRRILEDSP